MDTNHKIFQTLSTSRNREKEIESFLFSGLNINFGFSTVKVTQGQDVLEYYVSNDYLSLGDNFGWIHCPMSPLTPRAFMRTNDYILPTPKMVRQIYSAAITKPRAVAWGELYKSVEKKFNRDSTKCYLDHSNKIKSQMIQLGHKEDNLIAGHKKDVVLTNILANPKYKNNVAIYGWFNSDGTVIQNLNAIDHIVSYVDYSHGLRMIKNDCLLNGMPRKLTDIFSDTRLATMIHDEPLRFKQYGT